VVSLATTTKSAKAAILYDIVENDVSVNTGKQGIGHRAQPLNLIIVVVVVQNMWQFGEQFQDTTLIYGCISLAGVFVLCRKSHMCTAIITTPFRGLMQHLLLSLEAGRTSCAIP